MDGCISGQTVVSLGVSLRQRNYPTILCEIKRNLYVCDWCPLRFLPYVSVTILGALWSVKIRRCQSTRVKHTHTRTHTHKHTHIHTHAHTHIHTRTHTRARAHTPTHTHTHTHAHTQERTHTRTHTRARAHTPPHTHMHTRTHTHAHTRTHPHTHARAYTHTHTHTVTILPVQSRVTKKRFCSNLQLQI